MTERVRRACDSCRFRKVRCDGLQPCSQCKQFGLECFLTEKAGRRRPYVRGRLVAQLRGSTEPLDFFLGMLPDFERLVYPMHPILSPNEMRAAIMNMNSHEDAALVYAFAAVTMDLTQSPSSNEQLVDLFQRSMTAYRQAESTEVAGELSISVKRIQTCMYQSMILITLKHFDRAFVTLREAISMIQATSTRREEAGRLKRLSWLAFIHERFLSIKSGYPPILTRMSKDVCPMKLEFGDSSLPPYVESGFKCLIHLFLTIDEPLLEGANVTSSWVDGKQAELDQDELNVVNVERELMVSGHGKLTEVQHADLFITRLWLRTLVWQLALSQGLLRSAPPRDVHEGLSLHFPAERLSSQLHVLVSHLGSANSIETHGIGILYKLFEITSTIADVLALPWGSHGRSPESIRPQLDNFIFLARFVLRLERIQTEQRKYLQEKVDMLERQHPKVDFRGEVFGASQAS